MSKWLNWTPGRLSEEPSKLQNSNSDGFDGASIEKSQKIEFHFDGSDGISGGASQNITFPHCPRCGSFALYRRNGQGDYECQSCGMQQITEAVARRIQ